MNVQNNLENRRRKFENILFTIKVWKEIWKHKESLNNIASHHATFIVHANVKLSNVDALEILAHTRDKTNYQTYEPISNRDIHLTREIPRASNDHVTLNASPGGLERNHLFYSPVLSSWEHIKKNTNRSNTTHCGRVQNTLRSYVRPFWFIGLL